MFSEVSFRGYGTPERVRHPESSPRAGEGAELRLGVNGGPTRNARFPLSLNKQPPATTCSLLGSVELGVEQQSSRSGEGHCGLALTPGGSLSRARQPTSDGRATGGQCTDEPQDAQTAV